MVAGVRVTEEEAVAAMGEAVTTVAVWSALTVSTPLILTTGRACADAGPRKASRRISCHWIQWKG